MMKLLLSTLFSICSLYLSAQIYVSQTATGANDGSSWENAYTDLNSALAPTNSGDVWIATGIYTPTGGDQEARFNVSSSLSLYGGFAGTETNVSERNISANPTNLSGDIDGNDMDFDFENRDDNVYTVVYVDSLIDKVIFDGLIISGGNGTAVDTFANGDNRPEHHWAGAGIFSYSTIEIRDSELHNNFARRGASISISSASNGGNGTQILNSEIYRNRAVSQAIVFLNGLSDVDIVTSIFRDNDSARGAIYPLRCNNLEVFGCLFDNNNTTWSDTWGGALFIWNSNNLLFLENTFRNNFAAGSGGAIYLDGREDAEGNNGEDNVLFQDCVFEDNAASFGGALYTWEMAYSVEGCTFRNNSASPGNDAGASANYGNSGKSRIITYKNSTFDGHAAQFGGALVCGGTGGEFEFSECEFSNNSCVVSGGSMLVGFGAGVKIEDCVFENGTADFGGAIAIQDVGTSSISNSIFELNNVTSNGGVITILYGHTLNVDNSRFDFNIAEGTGGVINTFRDNTTGPGFLNIENSQFYNNQCGTQGGVINLGNFNFTSINSVYAYNENASNEGAGGVVSANASDSLNADVIMTNNTLHDNSAAIGSGIGAFNDNSTPLNITLQNNILDNGSGDNIAIEEGTPKFISGGGNLSTDGSTEGVLIGTNDISNSDDPMFNDPDELDYSLMSGSPAINIGIGNGAPPMDIEGTDRIGEPDAGAYEFNPSDFVNETIIDNDGLLSVLPNPVGEILTFEIDNEWTGNIQSKIIDINGQVLRAKGIQKSKDKELFQWDVKTLNTGIYFIVVEKNNQAILSKVIKM